jgi:hypothetical protein
LVALVIGAIVGAFAGYFSGGMMGAILGAMTGGYALALMLSYVAGLHDEIPVWSGPVGRILGPVMLFVLLAVLLLVLGRP